MTDTRVVTPETWFDLPRLAAVAEAGAALDFTVADADGRQPLAAVPLAELRAVHHIYGAWWPDLGTDRRPASLSAGAYDRFLEGSRALLRQRCEAVLAARDRASAPAPALLTFPDLGHPLLSDSLSALALLKHFVWLPHSPSLVAWARRLAAAHDACSAALSRPWMRLVWQKVAVDNHAEEVLACLRTVYAGDDRHRLDLLAVEASVLDECHLGDLVSYARALGLDRPTRTTVGIAVPGRRAPAPEPPDITVLVPSYMHERYVEATLESVLAQSYSAFGVLVVDDRSPDDTVARASRLDDPRLRVRVNATNLGLGDSVLRALDTIDTPYVALLNSDDLFHPERLARCRAALEQRPQAQVVATGVATIDAESRGVTVDSVSRLFDGQQIADWLQWHADRCRVAPDADLAAELLERNFLVTSSNIVARTGFLRGCAEALRGLKYCLDWQVFLEAAAVDGLVVLPEPLLGYRLHSSNTVWFDEERRTTFALEVNRVLAHALRRRLAQTSPGNDSDTAQLLDLLANHAAQHSDASGLAMYANDLVGNRRLDDARSRSADVHRHVRAITVGSRPGRADSSARDDAHELLATAARASAEMAREDAACDRARASAADAAASASAAQLGDALGREAVLRLEIARMRVSPEYLVGDRLWNRAGLSRLGWPLVRAIRTLRDRRNRWTLALGRAAHGLGLARPRAVVAACWSFPIHSQTFVYQEMQALAWAGFACRVFCCDTNPRSELPAAFGELWDKRLVMQTERSAAQRDLAHFRRTRPERVEALLTRLGEATGRSREALLNESIVQAGFTFARHVELSGAEYLHTYFFYDQSFLALMAAFLLQIPRGITAYADHMLGDYAFKCVPLHLELADIVVATSRRIKTELGAIGGGRYDDKIIVKPNGIDVARFPHVAAAVRLAASGTPQLIAVNRIEPKKGLIHLVDAMGLLRARGVAARLNIVGGVDVHTPASAECHRQLVARIEELQLADCIVLHGVKQQHEFVPLLERSRIFLAPYVEVDTGDKDGIPTAVLEAMSSGLPVVATDAGSIFEAVADGVEGLGVPQRDPQRLADAIERLLTDGELYLRMSNAARQRAVSEFDIHVTELKLHERIRACLARPAAP